jgi:D-inositol-3-phosphate glycosyltransferase
MIYRMRIAMLSMHSCPWSRPGGRYTGGMNIYIQNLSREMGKLGIATDIFTCSHEGDELCNFNGPAGNVRLIHIDTGSRGWTAEAGQADFAAVMAQAVNSYCRERDLRYDVIHSHYWLSGLAGNHLKDLWQVPHITMFHTLGALKNNSFPGSIETASRMSHERMLLHSCDRVIASTPAEKLEMVDRYSAPADRISVIPCGIDLSLFHPVHRQTARAICGIPERKTLLFVGRPDPIKGLENLLRAASMLGPDGQFQLLVIGCGNRYMGDWWQAAGNNGGNDIKDRIIYAGPVEHAKMYLYYSAADLCVIPSYYESFCMTALESVACGTPVLATAVGEIPEISRLSSLCKAIPDNNPISLARHIGILLQGNGQAGDCTESQLSLHYGWDSIACRIIMEYEDIVKEPVNTCKAAAAR